MRVFSFYEGLQISFFILTPLPYHDNPTEQNKDFSNSYRFIVFLEWMHQAKITPVFPSSSPA
jgi:hypothetical protein